MPSIDLYQVSLKILLQNERGETLILATDPKSNFEGFHDLPGGRIDENEFTTPFGDIIARELNEELGSIDADIDRAPAGMGRDYIPAHRTKTGKDIHILYVVFWARYKGGEIIISDEHTGFKWVNLKEKKLEELFIPGIKDAVAMALENKEGGRFPI